MKRIFVLALMVCVFFGEAYAQTAQKKKKVKKPVVAAKPAEISLPPRSADCFFAMNLMLDSSFGPTEPLQGFGYVNEIHKDAQTKNVFDAEHNSVWYKIDCPYAGKLILDITPRSESDDYDFLVYKYTDRYFCNRVEKNRVKPVRSVMSTPDGAKKGMTGLSLTATVANIAKTSSEAYGRYIDVLPGESYIVVVDNLQDGGLGHTIRAEIYTEHRPLYIQVIDSLEKQRTTANIRVKELDSETEVLNVEQAGNTKLKLLPQRRYEINVTKNGYFNYKYNIDYDDLAKRKDSVLTVRLAQIKVGSVLKLKGDLYFDNDENDSVVVMKESYESLDEVARTLNEYPHLKVEIIGRISTDGLNLAKDTETSHKRAQAIKAYLVTKGIKEENIITRGSTKKELLSQLEEQNKRNTTVFPACEIKIKAVN